jgi:hypothetical protein
MALFVAEIEIEAHPPAVVGAVGCGYPQLVQPPLEGGPYLSGAGSIASLLTDTARALDGI